MRKLSKAIIAVLCIVLCMSIFFACDPAEEPAAHEHNYSELKSDSTYHWYVCPDDGEVKPDSKVEHVDTDRNGKCDVCDKAVTVVDINGVSFAIAGKDGKTNVDLNGVEVTITYKTNSFKATIADGKFVSNEIIPIGTYTVSATGYNSTTIEITKDGIDQAVVVLNKTVNIATSVEIKEIEGVPTLVAEGMIPEIENVTIGNVMLHYDASWKVNANDEKETKHDYYVANTSDYKEAYHFELKLTDLPINGRTPWCWFHIYAYAEENPTEESTVIASVDLNRGEKLSIGQELTHAGVKYTVQAWNNIGDSLVLQAEANSAISEVTSVGIKSDDLTLVVKGKTSKDVSCLKIHVEGDGKHYYSSAAVSATAGEEFELNFDLKQLNAVGSTYYFHIWEYTDEEPENNYFNYASTDVPRNGFIEGNLTVDVDDLRYTIVEKDWDQIVVEVKAVPKTAVTSIEFDTTGDVPALVIKGTVADDVPAIKLHAWHEGELYWDNLSTEKNQMEFKVPVTEFTKIGNVAYIHTRTYDATAEEGKQYGPEDNVVRGNLIAAGTYVEHKGIRYWVKADEGLQVVPVSIESVAKLDITSVSIDTTEGLTLVVKGSTNQQIPCLKIHADGDGENWYSEGVSVLTEGGGEFELKFDLTQLKTDGTPWCWFHIYAYADVNPTDNAEKQSTNLTGNNWYIRGGESVTYNGVKYTAVSGDGTYGVFIIQPSVVAAE